jgi:tetratricopeptide (TPR) repeat protein
MADDPTLDEQPAQPARPEADPGVTIDEDGGRPAVHDGSQTLGLEALREAAGGVANGDISGDATGAWAPSVDTDRSAVHDGSQTLGYVADGSEREHTENLTGEYVPDLTDNEAAVRAQAPTRRAGPAPESREGDHTGKFLLRKFHAKGGMGEVWVAEDSRIGRVVALKKIRSGREAAADKFLHEAQITGQLEHPGVVPVHEVGQDDTGHPYYVMKFVHGATYKEAIEAYHEMPAGPNRDVQFVKLLQVFINLCQTVAYAHSRNVIHRDIKPENVMVGQYGETLVLDWGLAKVVGEGAGTETMPEIRISGDIEGTQFGAVKGTPSYMSPEVADGKPEEVDQISDVYLLGGCLYQLLTNKKPRTAAKVTEFIELARKTPIPPARLSDPNVPRPLDAICQKSLAMKKPDRYQTAEALAEDVQRYLAGEPVSAYRETVTERAWRWINKHKVGLSRAAMVAVVLALVGAGAWVVSEYAAALEASEKKRLADIAEEQERGRLAKAAADLRAAQDEADKLAAQKEADRLAAIERAKGDLKRFRELAEEMQFFHVIYDNANDPEPLYGADSAVAKGRAALAALAPWGTGLEKLPLPEEQAAARRELYDTLLKLAYLLLAGDPTPEVTREAVGLLDRAGKLQPPTVAALRLRGRALRVLGDATAAGDADHKATKAPVQALDHYLAGDQALADALSVIDSTDAARGERPWVGPCNKAITHYFKAVEADPDFVWAWWQMARAHLMLGNSVAAGQSLTGCITLRPSSPCGFILRGLAMLPLDRRAEALANLDHAVDMAPDFRPARLHRGMVRMLDKKVDEAVVDFEAALADPPQKRLPAAAYYLGQIYQEKGDLDKALVNYGIACAAEHPVRDAFLKRAKVCFQQGKVDDGLAALDGWLKQGKTPAAAADLHALRGRQLHNFARTMTIKDKADVALRRKRLEQALDEVKLALEKRPTSAALWAEAGELHERLKDPPAAIEAYTKALVYAPDKLRLLVKRGFAWDSLKDPDYDAALKDFADALQVDPKDAEAHTGMGYFSACKKQTDAALRHANKALHFGSGSYMILHNVACIYARLADNDAEQRVLYEDLALDQLRRGIELWRDGRPTLTPMDLMRREGAFVNLRKRPEFKKLLEEK